MNSSIGSMLSGTVIAIGAVAGLGLGTAAALAVAQELPQNFVLHDAPKDVPALHFQDGDGKVRSIDDFRGKVVLLNIWATWCGPCRHEMPTLDRLQAEFGGPDFEVVALSIDRAGIGVVTKFYAEIRAKHLAIYIDSSGKAAQLLSMFGLPTTLLIDREGREIGRLIGPAEWDTPEMLSFFRRLLSQTSGALSPSSQNETAVIYENLGSKCKAERLNDAPVRVPGSRWSIRFGSSGSVSTSHRTQSMSRSLLRKALPGRTGKRLSGETLVAVVQSTDLRECDDLAFLRCRSWPWKRCVLVQGQVGAGSVTVREVGPKNAPKVPLVPHDDMIQARTAD